MMQSIRDNFPIALLLKSADLGAFLVRYFMQRREDSTKAAKEKP